MSTENELLATCYLGRADDEKNKAFLTSEKLIIRYKGNDYDFPWDNIKSIGFGNRKLMLFLLIGAVSASFSIIAYIKYLVGPIPVLIFLLLGFLMIYIGYTGKSAFYIEEKQKTSDFLLDVVTPNLSAFAKFANQYLYQVSKGVKVSLNFTIYHIIEKNVWQHIQAAQWYQPDSLEKEGFIHCSHYDQVRPVISRFFKDAANLVLLKIDPLKVKAEIRYEKGTDSDELFPHIYGPLNLDAVLSAEEVS